MASPPLAQRRFSMADQEAFARFSGDRNPLHLDPLAARRTQAGMPVVHGAHAVLWALDRLAASGWPLVELRGLSIQFKRFLALDHPLELHVHAAQARRLQLRLIVDGEPATIMLLNFDGTARPPASFEPAPRIADTAIAVPDFDRLAGQSGRLLAPQPDATAVALFPHAAAALGARAVTGIGQLSRLVGMVCPGLHSIFARMELALDGDPAEYLGYRVATADARFRLVRSEVRGLGIAGSIDAFMRHPPVAAPALAVLAKRVQADEFAGRTVLIAGGSRGLGEISARLLAAGGARLVVSYRQGRAEAEALAAELRAARGAEACRLLALDALEPVAAQLAGVRADSLLWFVTPQIFRQPSAAFSAKLFAEFERAYVAALAEAVAALPDLQTLFYPSSVALDQHTPGMAEYCRAKAMGEALCRDIAGHRPSMRVLAERLPRVLTDQTATVARVDNADPVEIMLPLLRQLWRAPSATAAA